MNPSDSASNEINMSDPHSGTNPPRSSLHGGRRPAERASCDERCKRTTTSQAHCGSCHVTFAGVRGFDVHRRGGVCHSPDSFGYIERDGVWHKPGGDERAAAYERGGRRS